MSEEQKVAEQLRRAREQQGISLDDVRRKTGLSANVLHALEEGRFDVVEPVFLRLALRAYVQYLRLDPDETLGALEREYASAEATQVTVPPPPPAPMTRPVPHASWGLRLSVAAVLVVAAAAAYVFITRDREEDEAGDDGASRTQLPMPEPERRPAFPRPAAAPARGEGRPAASEVETTGAASSGRLTMPAGSEEAAPAPLPESLQPSPAPLAGSAPPATSTAAAPETVSTPATPAGVENDSLVALSVEARDSTWVQILAGGKVQFEGILGPGTRKTWRHPEAIVVHAGRARGLRYWLQGQAVPEARLGEPNRVLRFRATREGITLLNPAPPPAARDTTAGPPPADAPR